MADRLVAEPQWGRRPKSHALLDGFPDYDVELEVAASIGLTSEQFYDLPEVEQNLQLARWERRQQPRCPHCGLPPAECADPARLFYPQRKICRPTMEARAAERRYRKLHAELPFHDGTFTSWAKDADGEHPYHFEDGVTIWAAPTNLAPDDDFLDQQGGDDDDEA